MFYMPKKLTNEEITQIFGNDKRKKTLFKKWEKERNMQIRFFTSRGFFEFLTPEEQSNARKRAADALFEGEYEDIFNIYSAYCAKRQQELKNIQEGED